MNAIMNLNVIMNQNETSMLINNIAETLTVITNINAVPW